MSFILNPYVFTSGGGGGDDPPITSNLLVHYNPDIDVYSNAGTTPAVNGDYIAQFNDQSGNNNTLTQTTSSLQPIYDTTTFGNGLASIKSLNDSLIPTSTLNFTTTTDMTFYLVYKKSANANIWYLIKGSSSYPRTAHRTDLFQLTSDPAPASPASASRNVTYTDDMNIKIMAITNEPSNGKFKMYINGSYIGEDISSTYYASNPLSYTFGQFFANSNAIMNTGNVLFYDDIHDVSQVGQVSDWLNDKYNIY